MTAPYATDFSEAGDFSRVIRVWRRARRCCRDIEGCWFGDNMAFRMQGIRDESKVILNPNTCELKLVEAGDARTIGSASGGLLIIDRSFVLKAFRGGIKKQHRNNSQS